MPIDEIINDGTNMVVGAAQGAVADQLPETIIVTPDNNLERPTDVRLPKDVNWYNKAIDVFNLEKGTKLPKVADAVEIADDDYMAVTKHFNDRVVNDYNTTNDKLKLGLPLVTDISEIKPENSQKIDEAKVVSHINKANKELKMAQDVLGGELLKFEPFRSLDDMRNRADDFMAKLEKATNAKDKNKLLSDVNKYITNANKENGLNVPLFSNADDAKKAITVGKDGVAPLAKQFEVLSSDKQPDFGDELRSGLLNPMATDLPEKNLLDRQKAMAEKEMADLERSKKRIADIAILSKKAQKDGTPFLESTYLKFLNNGATQYASQAEADAEVVRLRTENPNIKGVGVRQVSDEYGNTKWQVSVAEEVDAQYYKDAQNITAEGALIKQKQANALMPEYKALKEEINRYTMQGIAVPPQILAKYDDVSSTIQDYLTASNILTDVASENYVKYNNLESKRGGFLSAIAFEGVESFNRITEGIMTLGLTIPELLLAPLPSNVADNTDIMKATQKGKQNVGEFFEKRTRYLQDVFGIAPQYRGGAVTDAVSGAVGILPYILGGELAVPFMVATGVDANLKALEGEKGLSTNEKNLIALVKGSIGAYVMSKGLDVIGGHTAINRIAYNTMKNLPVNFTGKTLQNLVGKEVTQYISNTTATSGSFGALNVASGVADIGVNELAKVATDGRFNPQASHDVLKDLGESFVHGLGTGVVLGGVTGFVKLGADKISNEREFRKMDAMVQDPSLIPIIKLKLGQQVVDKKINADEYKKAIANINSVANIASQIPKDFSNSSRYQSFKLLKENAEYEKQKAGLAPVYIKRIDGLIEANNAELIKIADNESVKSIPNDTQNSETTNSESTTTDGTNEVATQETKVMDDGAKVENDVVSLAAKIRKLKTQKGALNSDITGGLKDYALEEIAQLIEDGTVVIEAIKKVLANSKYASLNKDEIRNLVFSVNPLTEKDFERNDSEKVVDRNKRLEADLKQRGYTQNEIDYILRGGVDRIEKVDTVREETKVVDNLNKILKSVQAKAKDMPLKEAVDKAIERVQGEWVKGKEIILENAIRKFKKEHEIAVTNPTDRAVKPKPIMITVDEKKALTDQIKLEVKAATEGAKSITDGFKEVAKIVNEILKQHKTTISTRQLNAIQKRMAYLKVGSNESVRKYVDYIEKVLANAEYADQLASVKATNKKLKKALKNDKIPASVRATANDFIKLDPADVENLNKHEAYANELLEAMKSGGIKVQDGNVIDKTRKAADLVKIGDYVESELVDAKERALKEMEEEIGTPEEGVDYSEDVKKYIQDKFHMLNYMVRDMLHKLGKSPVSGDTYDFTDKEISDITKVLKMDLNVLENVKDRYEVIEALDHLLTNGDLGLIPHILNKYQNAVTVKKGTQTLINKMAGNISLLPITKFFAQMEKLVTTTIPFGKRNPKDSYGTKIFFDNSSFRRWDNLVKNFKDYGIYESTFYHLAKAYANYKTLVRQMDAQRISKELFASNGYDQKKTLESKFKITAYLRQLEFESNPESKTNKPAIDYLNATIEAAENLNHPIQGKALDMLKDVVSKHTVDGQISLESLRNSFTQGEKKAIADLQKTYKALAPYHNKVSLAIRNKAFTAIENYSHISAYSKDNIVLTPSATKREYMNVLKGTKSGTIEERTGAASAINLDPFSTANKAVRDVMLDYWMTNPFKNVGKILDNFAKYSIDELKKYPRGTAEYENALKRKNIADAWLDIYSDARENMLGRSYFETNPFKEFMQLAAKRAVEFTLGKPDRLLAELFSNMGFVMSSATKEFALGSTKYLKYNGGEIQAKIMENVQSSATERLHPHGGIATSVMDTQDFDIAVADDQNISSPVRRKALQFYYNTLAKGIGTGQMINEGMITSGDLLIARPIWTGTMATEFKKITGKDIDFDKIAENDIEYMDANEEAIDKARTVADRKVTDAAASKNPFETAPKMSNRSTQILQALNTYMRGFNMTEYELASDALMHLEKGGKMSAKDATRILSGISARAGLYKAVQAKAATAMMAAIMGGWAMLQNDEEKTEVDKLIGNMGDDTPENRRKVAAKLLELFATSNPNIPELAGMGEVGDALKTTDEETVKFWKRATEEPNTFIEDVVKGIGQQYLSLLTQRNFGNIVQGFLTAPLFEEYVNKKLRDDYDPYKDSYLYSKLPDTGKKNWLIRSIEANLGAYGLPLAMLMDITVAGIELRTNIKKLDAVNEELKKHIDKVPLEKNKLEDWFDLKDRQKSLEKKIEDSYKSIAKEVAIAAGMGTGAIPALKNIDKAMDKIMQDAYKLPKDWKKIQEKIEAIKNGVSPEDIMNAENKQKAVSEIYDVIEPGEKMPDIYDDAIKKVLEK